MYAFSCNKLLAPRDVIFKLDTSCLPLRKCGNNKNIICNEFCVLFSVDILERNLKKKIQYINSKIIYSYRYNTMKNKPEKTVNYCFKMINSEILMSENRD